MIIHFMPNGGGGTPKHVIELGKLFPEYTHGVVRKVGDLSHAICSTGCKGWKRVHVHSAVNQNYTAVQWDLVDVLARLRTTHPSLECFMTVHDYQWLIPSKPNPTKEDFFHHVFDPLLLAKTKTLMGLMDRVIFPSHSIRANYEKVMSLPPAALVTPHCDVVYNVPVKPLVRPVKDAIHIAFVGYYFSVKGHYLFDALMAHLPSVDGHPLVYHVFGEVHQKSPNLSKAVLHGGYTDDSLVDLLWSSPVHCVCHLSGFEESYCYALTHTMASRLPMFYLRRGAIEERLGATGSDLYWGFENGFEMIPQMKAFLRHLLAQPPYEGKAPKAKGTLCKTEWYRSNYK